MPLPEAWSKRGKNQNSNIVSKSFCQSKAKYAQYITYVVGKATGNNGGFGVGGAVEGDVARVVGSGVGGRVGFGVGLCVELGAGFDVGSAVGFGVGLDTGADVGAGVGS
jgi:hypothetical protein